MERLVVARHGDFDPGFACLNKQGQQQAVDLAERLAAEFPSSLAIFSSVGPRAQETAHIIAEHLGLSLVVGDEFGSAGRGGQSEGYPRALERLAAVPAKMVLIVTKGEFAGDFFDYCGKRLLGKGFAHQELARGEALVLDLTRGEICPLH